MNQSNEIAAATVEGLTGVYGHTFAPSGRTNYLFRITRSVGDVWFVAELFSDRDGDFKGDLLLLNIADLADRQKCALYATAERWMAETDRLEQHFKALKK